MFSTNNLPKRSKFRNAYSSMRTLNVVYVVAFVAAILLLIVIIFFNAQDAKSSIIENDLKASAPDINTETTPLYPENKPMILPNDELPAEQGASQSTMDVSLHSSNSISNNAESELIVNGQKIELDEQGNAYKNISSVNIDGTRTIDVFVSSDSSGTSDSRLDLELRSESETYMRTD